MPSCHRSHRQPIVSSRIQHYQRMMLLRRLSVQEGQGRHEDETNGSDGEGHDASSSARGQRTARRLVMASLMDTHSHRPDLTRQDVHDMLNRALQVTALYSARCVVATDERNISDTRSVAVAVPIAVISDENRSGDTETSSDTSSCGNKSGGDGDRSLPL